VPSFFILSYLFFVAPSPPLVLLLVKITYQNMAELGAGRCRHPRRGGWDAAGPHQPGRHQPGHHGSCSAPLVSTRTGKTPGMFASPRTRWVSPAVETSGSRVGNPSHNPPAHPSKADLQYKYSWTFPRGLVRRTRLPALRHRRLPDMPLLLSTACVLPVDNIGS